MLFFYFQNLLLNEKVYGRKTPTYLIERYNCKKLKKIKISDGIEPSASLQNDITLRNEKMLFLKSCDVNFYDDISKINSDNKLGYI